MKAFKRLTVLAAMAILSSAAFHACDGNNPFGIFVPDAVLTTTTGANLGSEFDDDCGGDCDGDPSNDKQISTFTGESGTGASIAVDNIGCTYMAGESVSADMIEDGLVAAINGEDADCGPDNIHVEAVKGSVIVTGLFGGWAFDTGTEGAVSSSESVGPENDAYALAELLTDTGFWDGVYSSAELLDQADDDDLFPASGPFAFQGSTTVNCNSTGGDEGDASNGTFSYATSVRGAVASEAATRIPPVAPAGVMVSRMTHLVNFSGCEITGDFWGDGSDETLTLNGQTLLTVLYDPEWDAGSGGPSEDSETVTFDGNLTASYNGSVVSVQLRSDSDGNWWTNDFQNGGFCFGGAVLFGDEPEDSLDDNCTGNGVFIPLEFTIEGIPDFYEP